MKKRIEIWERGAEGGKAVLRDKELCRMGEDDMRKRVIQDKYLLCLMILCIISMLINISLIFNDSVWCDESFTMITLQNNFRGIIEATARDVHPPLYYLITKCIVMALGYSVPAAKISSLLGVFFTMVLGITIIRRRLARDEHQNFFASVLYILMLAFIPCSLLSNLEVRMYTWAMFFVTATGTYAFEVYESPMIKKNWLAFAAASVCAAYTHYFALVAVCLIYLFLLVALLHYQRVMLKPFVLVCIFDIIAYAPWLSVLLKQIGSVKEEFWIPELTLQNLLEYLQWLFSGSFCYIWFIIVSFCVLLAINYFIENKEKRDEQNIFICLCFMVFVGVICIGWILSKIIRPVFVGRYMFVSMGVLYIFIAYSISYFVKIKQVKLFMLSIMLCTAVYSYNDRRNEEYENGTEETKRIITENISSCDLLASDDTLFVNENGGLLRYYIPDNDVLYIQGAPQFEYMDRYEKTWYFCTSNFEQEVFELHGYNAAYVCHGTIDDRHPYDLYLIQKMYEE